MTEQEKREFFKFEKTSQQAIDKYYTLRGHTVDRSVSCISYDCILDGKVKVEEKIRQVERSDILIELIQDAVSYSPGWFYETKCDYLHYIFMDGTGTSIARFIRLNWSQFKNWVFTDFLKNNKHPHSVISDKGWGITVNISVPISTIPRHALTFDSNNQIDSNHKTAP